MFKQGDLVEHLKLVPLFKFAKRRELHLVAKELDVVELPENSTVITEGEHGDSFFVILEGAAKVVHKGKAIARLGVGDHFGELALLDPAPRNATVITTEATKLGRLKAGAFDRVLREVPAARPRLLTALARRARESGLKDASG